MLQDIDLKDTYNSDTDDLLSDFYIPALSNSILYCRITAYFSASSLFVASAGFTKLLESNGKVKLILGNELSENDFEAISNGYKAKFDTSSLIENLGEEIAEISDNLLNKRLDALSKLIELGRVEIKIAHRKSGIFHDKIGIFSDSNGNSVSFTGSANESSAALINYRNSESLVVFKSWNSGTSNHHESKFERFNNLWNHNATNTIVQNFEDAEKDKVVRIIKQNAIYVPKEDERELLSHSSRPNVPKKIGGNTFALRNHQRNALNAWMENKASGILALATGAGKTITAIYGATVLQKEIKPMLLVIGVPYQNLGDQWCEILNLFNYNPIKAYKSKNIWSESLKSSIESLNLGTKDVVACVVVNNTLKSELFQQTISSLNQNVTMFFIGDECHHYASKTLNVFLPQHATLKLGLSATPFHYLDEDANDRLRQYFGDVVSEYSLRDALSDGILTPYDYHVIPVELTEEEATEYSNLSHEISKRFTQSSNNEDEYLGNLLRKRSRLLNSASNKLNEFSRLLNKIEARTHTLAYCGDGNVEFQNLENDESYDQSQIRQVEAVTSLLSNKNWQPSRFTSEENSHERDLILRDFSEGSIKTLVAIRCLDEGIDIPACSTAFFLASSSNPRQFIQRRGRILRKSLGKEKATIYDFFVYIRPEVSTSKFEINLMRRELERVIEFASSSLNRMESYSVLRPILIQYGLEGHL